MFEVMQYPYVKFWILVLSYRVVTYSFFSAESSRKLVAFFLLCQIVYISSPQAVIVREAIISHYSKEQLSTSGKKSLHERLLF